MKRLVAAFLLWLRRLFRPRGTTYISMSPGFRDVLMAIDGVPVRRAFLEGHAPGYTWRNESTSDWGKVRYWAMFDASVSRRLLPVYRALVLLQGLRGAQEDQLREMSLEVLNFASWPQDRRRVAKRLYRQLMADLEEACRVS